MSHPAPGRSPTAAWRNGRQGPGVTSTSHTPDALAADWTACGGNVASEASNGLAQLLLTDFLREQPQLAWDAILLIVKAYSQADLYSDIATQAQQVFGTLAAGPVEDLLSLHGRDFIDRFEREARADRRMAWVLGGVWRFDMGDEVWNRVRNAADDSHWNPMPARNAIDPD